MYGFRFFNNQKLVLNSTTLILKKLLQCATLSHPGGTVMFLITEKITPATMSRQMNKIGFLSELNTRIPNAMT